MGTPQTAPLTSRWCASLECLSAECPLGTQIECCIYYLLNMSRMPFGGVPVGHGRALRNEWIPFQGLECLSAECPLGTPNEIMNTPTNTEASRMPFGGVPVGHNIAVRATAPPPWTSRMPFGGVPVGHYNAAQLADLRAAMSRMPFGGVPVGHRTQNRTSQQAAATSRMPFGGVPVGHVAVWVEFYGHNMRLECLSAECPLGTFLWHIPSSLLVLSRMPFGGVPVGHA